MSQVSVKPHDSASQISTDDAAEVVIPPTNFDHIPARVGYVYRICKADGTDPHDTYVGSTWNLVRRISQHRVVTFEAAKIAAGGTSKCRPQHVHRFIAANGGWDSNWQVVVLERVTIPGGMSSLDQTYTLRRAERRHIEELAPVRLNMNIPMQDIDGCQHNRHRYQCKDCGGSEICPHGRQRAFCRDCGGSQICEHGRQRPSCKECGGCRICEHGRERNTCIYCSPEKVAALREKVKAKRQTAKLQQQQIVSSDTTQQTADAVVTGE